MAAWEPQQSNQVRYRGAAEGAMSGVLELPVHLGGHGYTDSEKIAD
jgi:hypothetical protein